VCVCLCCQVSKQRVHIIVCIWDLFNSSIQYRSKRTADSIESIFKVSPAIYEKSPTFHQKSPTFHQKSSTFHQKSTTLYARSPTLYPDTPHSVKRAPYTTIVSTPHLHESWRTCKKVTARTYRSHRTYVKELCDTHMAFDGANDPAALQHSATYGNNL